MTHGVCGTFTLLCWHCVGVTLKGDKLIIANNLDKECETNLGDSFWQLCTVLCYTSADGSHLLVDQLITAWKQLELTKQMILTYFFIPAALSRRVPLPATSTLTPDYLLLSTTVGPEYFSEPVVFTFTSVKKFNEYFSYYRSICTTWVSVLLNYRFF